MEQQIELTKTADLIEALALGGIALESEASTSPPVDLGISDLSEVLNGLPRGQRDAAIFKYASSRIARGLSREEITRLVLEAARNCTPPFPENEALAKIESAFRIHKRKHPQYREPGTGDGIAGQVDPSDALERGRRLLEEIPRDPSILGLPENSRALATIKTEDPRLFIELGQVARKHKVKAHFDDAVRRGTLRVADNESTDRLVSDALAAVNIPIPEEIQGLDLVMPSGFTFDQAGTCMLTPSKDGIRRDEVAPGWLLVTSLLKDFHSGEEHVTLAFFKRQVWHRHTIERAAAMDARRLIAAVSGQGAPIGSDNCAMAAKYLLKFDSANADILPLDRIKNRFGWNTRA